MQFMSMLRQIRAVTWMNLRSIPQRFGTSSVIVVGIAGVVAVLISVLAMATGFTHTVLETGRDDRAIVLRGGSNSELASTLSRDTTLTVMDAPGIRKDSGGKAIASAEPVVIVDMPKKSDGSGANVTIRGVGIEAAALRPEIQLAAGRMFQRGLRELIVGRGAEAQFKGLDVGSHIALRGSDWSIVGAFTSHGDSHESELLADAETVLSAYRRNLFQSVVVLLNSRDSFDTFKTALTTNPQLSVDVMRERGYYAKQSQRMSALLSYVAYVVGGIMAVGALFGALNTMYSAVSVRSREIATLRAMGFGSAAVVLSVLIEAMLLSVMGALIGAGLAWLFFNGNVVSTLGSNFTQVVFRLAVSPALVVLGVLWACAIGLLGGLFPAIRAARLPVATALRAV
jgi:putative ABC transport system permease protein